MRQSVHGPHLDRDHEVSIILEEHMRVDGDNTGLVRLGNIGEHNIDHWHQHTVSLRMASIFDDWHDIDTLLGSIDEVTASTLRELDSIHHSFL